MDRSDRPIKRNFFFLVLEPITKYNYDPSKRNPLHRRDVRAQPVPLHIINTFYHIVYMEDKALQLHAHLGRFIVKHGVRS